MNQDPDMPSVGFFTRWTVVSAFLLGLFLIISTSVVLSVQPAWMGFSREVQKNSHQYVEAKESNVLLWIAEFDRLELEALKYDEANKPKLAKATRLQRASILDRIRTEATRFPEGATPTTIEDFLEKH